MNDVTPDQIVTKDVAEDAVNEGACFYLHNTKVRLNPSLPQAIQNPIRP
jgi:hypothetical protein